MKYKKLISTAIGVAVLTINGGAATLSEFTAYGFSGPGGSPDLVAEVDTSTSYDVSVIYRKPGNSTLYGFYGWGNDLPLISSTTSSDYIQEFDYATYAAQWDHSVTPRTNWDPNTANIVVYY